MEARGGTLEAERGNQTPSMPGKSVCSSIFLLVRDSFVLTSPRDMAEKRKKHPVENRTVGVLEAELEQCTVERDEALAREAAITAVLQIINSSPGDVLPVFDAI